MSSVSVFAFIDKEGIVTENQKYVDELAVFDEREERCILDFKHNSDATVREDEVYELEGETLK